MRHGQDDESTIDGLFDNSLINEGLGEVEVLAGEVAQHYYNSDVHSDVRILHSPKLRAYQTAALLHRHLSTHGVPVSLRTVDDLRELYQGEMVLDNDETLADRAATLQDAWHAYSAAVEACDLTYRFGDSLASPDTPAVFPALQGKFYSPGENQYEFTKRIYGFVRDTFQYDFDSSLPVVVAHRATVTKIQRVIGVCSLNADAIANSPPGNIRFLEREVQRIKVNHAEGVVLPLRHARFARDILEREIGHLIKQNEA